MVTRSDFLLIRRKMRLHIPQLLGLVLLLVVGVGFFITLLTISLRYEETAEQYFTDHAYADFTFYGAFDTAGVGRIQALDGVLAAQGRMVRDYREGERIFRAITLTDAINRLYLYEGRLPDDKTECILLKRNADALGLVLGDSVTLGGERLVISGLATSPEYVYLVQNERTVMAKADRFCVVYVTEGFCPEGYNEVVALVDRSVFTSSDPATTRAMEAAGVFRSTEQADQINHILYRSDLDETKTFAYVFPFFFAVLIAVVIYVMVSRIIQKDKRQIGVMKALGVTDSRILQIYLLQFCLTAFVGALLGCVAAVFLCDFVIGVFSAMFEVPALGFVVYPGLWLSAFSVSILLCSLSGLVALLPLLPLLPATAMRPRAPKGGRRILLERIGFLWKRLAFNTRYALKNSLRNKVRFFAVVLGMCGSCALLVFTLGFSDSISNTQDRYFNEFADYDVIVSLDPIPCLLEHPVQGQMDESCQALVVPVTIQDERYTLAVLDKGFDMLKIPRDALQDGVIIPQYFADSWGVDAGDTLEIDGHEAIVSAVIPQHLGLMLFTSYDYLGSVTREIPQVYNTIYGRSSDVASLSTYLKERGISFATLADDRTSFDLIMESISVLIWFMIACSLVLGLTVLYSVGLINLSAREYEYLFMGVMGYPHKGIMLAHIKETIIQLALAIPLGFLLGNVLLESIKGEFSSSNYVISPAVFLPSYLIAALLVIAVTALMVLVTSRYIKRLDMVEGLKAQDD